MENQNKWAQSGNSFIKASTASLVEKLSTGVYTIHTPLMQPIYLERDRDNFKFSYKIYGSEAPFVKRILRTYKNTKDNLGVLLNGIKGTGKSVTAKLVCNELAETHDMPVILVTKNFNGIEEFISSINQDVVIFIDEYEKVFASEDREDYENGSNTLLSLMDGALKSEYRRVFLFTTNKLYIDDNLLERPGRIRYKKEFNDLSKDAIIEIIDDILIEKSFKQSILSFLSTLNIITVDIVKAVVEEVNIHNEEPSNFKDVFNVSAKTSNKYDIYEGKLEKSGDITNLPIYRRNVIVNPNYDFENLKEDDFDDFTDVYFGRDRVGTLKEVKNASILIETQGKEKTKKWFTIVKREGIHESFVF